MSGALSLCVRSRPSPAFIAGFQRGEGFPLGDDHGRVPALPREKCTPRVGVDFKSFQFKYRICPTTGLVLMIIHSGPGGPEH